MTILASTPAYVVEHESGVFSIMRRADNMGLHMTGKRIVGDFRDCLRTHAPERVIQTYIRLGESVTKWEASGYKAGVLESLGFVAGAMRRREKRFAVIVRFEKAHAPAELVNAPLVYWHNAPAAAARRLASLIARRAAWVPKEARQGQRFYIVDHGDPAAPQYALTAFRKAFDL